MNRLIIVGNGFDLAHGLKTSYKDFIFWYLDQCFGNVGMYANGQVHDDVFLRISVLEHHSLMDLVRLSKGKGLSRYLYENGLLHEYLNYNDHSESSAKNFKESYDKVSIPLSHKVTFKSPFFKRLIDSCLECGWVDIEQEYFDVLKRYSDSDNSHDLDYIRTINDNFAFLKSKLVEYLRREEKNHSIVPNQHLVSVLNSPFKISDFDTVLDKKTIRADNANKMATGDEKKYKTYFLNFNYTNVIQSYKEKIQSTECEVNHIHGQLDNIINPVIFGFGDEHDKKYLEFEEQRNNDLFEHVKSYHYLKTSNYRNLVRFLNQDYYQVFVIGHSCGLSDRTMFKEIFDHENCKSVKIFHYTDESGKNDFYDKTINLGRHFSDKGRMRKLIVEFDEAMAFPQRNSIDEKH